MEFLDFNLDFLGFPILLLGFPRILLGFLLGFYQDFDLILIRFDLDSILAWILLPMTS